MTTGLLPYASRHPGEGDEAVPVESPCAEITDSEWQRLMPVATLAVIEALFDEVVQQPEDEWLQQVSAVLAAFKLMLPAPPFEEAWSMALAENPPPVSWQDRNKRARDELAARGYLYSNDKRGKRGDESPLRFAYRLMHDAYKGV